MSLQQSQFRSLEDPYADHSPPHQAPRREPSPVIKANATAIFGNFDGVVRPAEAIGVLVFFLGTTLILGIFVIILWLVGIGAETRRIIVLVTEVMIFFACISRLAGDLLQLDPGSLIFELREYREWREDYQAFKKWRLEQEYGSARKVEHTATITVKEGKSTLHYFGKTGDELEQCVEFAKAYLEAKAAGAQNLTAEKNWLGKGKLWPAGAAGREDWKIFKSFWIDQKMAKKKDGRGTWAFTLTGEEVLAEFAAISLDE